MNATPRPYYRLLVLLTTVLALVVVILGAYTRLADAGLGCPDWPGCYGHLGVPESPDAVAAANANFPERPVESPKAWKEMVHRYFAGTLGLMIFAIAILSWRRRQDEGRGVALPMAIAALVVFQALLGMWTVTLQLKPVVVMAHLLGGFTTLALLWWLFLRSRAPGTRLAAGVDDDSVSLTPRLIALVSLVVLYAQIALGGWTSANYAALACTDFPTCQSVWWPAMDFSEGFVLWRGVGVNYEFGILDSAARTAIHMSHRLGAIVTAGWLLFVGAYFLKGTAGIGGQRLALAMMVLLVLQVGLGITNIVAALPLGVAVAHNAVGALLLLSVVTLNHVVHRRSIGAIPVMEGAT
ncbi:MAG: COX15/CtaA family protein [Gammaproteobacteria bacterium]|nr:COX15/CtaA family protein [Gammaproteobacteria bacterium]